MTEENQRAMIAGRSYDLKGPDVLRRKLFQQLGLLSFTKTSSPHQGNLRARPNPATVASVDLCFVRPS